VGRDTFTALQPAVVAAVEAPAEAAKEKKEEPEASA
jgi:hypothetical protein